MLSTNTWDGSSNGQEAQMNKAGEKAIKSALANVEDNLYRYKNFGRPDDRTGNGELFSDVIKSLENERDQLKAALDQL
jgi:hypothetical protein